MPLPATSELNQQVDPEISAAVGAFTKVIMAGVPSQKAVTDLVSAVVGLTAAAAVANRGKVKSDRALACKAGCSYCCHLLVTVSAPEILVIQRFIENNFGPEQMASLKERLKSAGDILRGKDAYARLLARLPCPLLVDGKCSIYEVRPLVCRGYVSHSWTACAGNLRRHRPWKNVPVEPIQHSIYSDALDAMIKAVSEAGLDSHPLELISALSIALNNPDISGRWLSGATVFTEAIEVSEKPMTRVSIDGRIYDTSRAELIAEFEYGEEGTSSYQKEALYREIGGEFFLAGVGGPSSYYARLAVGKYVPGEDIVALSPREARRWLEDQGFIEKVELIFGTSADVRLATKVELQLSEEVARAAQHAAASTNRTIDDWIMTLVERELSKDRTA